MMNDGSTRVLDQLCGLDEKPFVRVGSGAGGVEPMELVGHSMVVDPSFGGRIVLFGGADVTGGLFYNTVWILSVATGKWSCVKGEGASAPSGRHFHSCVLFERSLWVFGGSSTSIHQDLHKFSLDTLRWTAVATLGVLPSPRYGHSAVVYNDCMYVYGGFDRNGFACNDVCEFCFATLSWDKPVQAGAAQEACYHSALAHEGSMYTFGGYRKTYNEIQEFRFATKTWSFLHTSGPAPKPRWGHAAAVYNRHMYVFGGRDRVSNFQDLFCFDFDSRVWKKIECSGIDSRFFCTGVVVEDSLYVFGGRNIHSFAFNDLLRVRLGEESAADSVADLQALVGDPECADLVFVMPDDAEDESAAQAESVIPVAAEFARCKRIYAHRDIVSNRSAALATMLRSDMQEGRTGVIALRGTTASAVRAMLVFLYTDLLVACDDVMAVLSLANQWQLFYLKQLCQERMVQFISLENVADTFVRAHELDASFLYDACRHFMHKNARLLEAQIGQLSPVLQSSIAALASPPTGRRREQ